MTTLLGADVGGSWVRAALYRGGQDLILRARRPIKSGQDPCAILSEILATWRLRKVDALTVGAKGVWQPAEKRTWSSRFQPLAGSVFVLSDLELAARSALGSLPGVAVLAGTGSAAAALDSQGRLRRFGGLGPLLGDEGSAFWLGKQWLRSQSEQTQRKYAVSGAAAIAALAPSVLQRNARLRDEGARLLAALALEAAKGLELSPIPLSWQGGLFRNEGFLRAFLRRIDRRFRPQAPLMDPEIYAATCARIKR